MQENSSVMQENRKYVIKNLTRRNMLAKTKATALLLQVEHMLDFYNYISLGEASTKLKFGHSFFWLWRYKTKQLFIHFLKQ